MAKNKLTKEQKQRIENRAEIDSAISGSYEVCDITIPIFGHICDKLDYKDDGPLGLLWKIIGYIMLGIVIIIDIIWDMIFIILQIGDGAVTGIPVIGSVFGFLDSLEIDDILDMFSLIVTFIFCGPIAAVLPAFGEFSEGVMEFLPFWTISITIWFIVVRPSRRRMIELESRGIADDEFAWNDDNIQKKSDDELLIEAADLYGIKIKE